MIFAHENLCVRFLTIPFGRIEIEKDLRCAFNLEEPKAVARDNFTIEE
jgi:hypothetical protein